MCPPYLASPSSDLSHCLYWYLAGSCLPITYHASALVSLKFSFPGAEVQLTDHTRDPTQNGKTDIDQEISIASSLEEDGERGEEDGEEVKANVRLGRSSLANCSGTGMDSEPLPSGKAECQKRTVDEPVPAMLIR